MGESWKLLAHLREQQSYCNAAFMTFQNTKLERGFCSGDLIVFQVGVKSFQQVSLPARPRPRGLPGVAAGGADSSASLSPARAGSSRRPATRAPPAPARGGSSACSAGARPGCAAEAGAPGGRALCRLAAPCRPRPRRFPMASPTKSRAAGTTWRGA